VSYDKYKTSIYVTLQFM